MDRVVLDLRTTPEASSCFARGVEGSHPVAKSFLAGPGDPQLDIPKPARSSAVNYGMGTNDLLEKLRECDEALVTSIARAETDTAAFAADLYEFCPGVVGRGASSLQALEDGLYVTGRV